PFAQTPKRGGFTMIELLGVMFVITMLLAIGVPTVIKYRTNAKIAICRTTVNTIDQAVDMYYRQHKEYPSQNKLTAQLTGLWYKWVKPEGGGAAVLKEFDDGVPGVGYRLQARGPIYGPWNGADLLETTGTYEEKENGGTDNRTFFVDAFSQNILYCTFDPAPIATPKGYEEADFDRSGSSVEDGISLKSLNDYAQDRKGGFYRRDYIVISRSADGKWGKVRGPDTASEKQYSVPTDDVTNFNKK
ncbi:MAG: hypothetical protein HN350_19425, partial [Phycisphaerales bacterium]|nr:hypothetical protein [Phycisphaerales bacterium]